MYISTHKHACLPNNSCICLCIHTYALVHKGTYPCTEHTHVYFHMHIPYKLIHMHTHKHVHPSLQQDLILGKLKSIYVNEVLFSSSRYFIVLYSYGFHSCRFNNQIKNNHLRKLNRCWTYNYSCSYPLNNNLWHTGIWLRRCSWVLGTHHAAFIKGTWISVNLGTFRAPGLVLSWKPRDECIHIFPGAEGGSALIH